MKAKQSAFRFSAEARPLTALLVDCGDSGLEEMKGVFGPYGMELPSFSSRHGKISPLEVFFGRGFTA